LNLLNFKEVVRVVKKRKKTHYKDYEICLDEIENLGTFIEIEKIGNENIEAFIKRELAISPIITLNAEGDKLVQVTATNIIDEARKYANTRTITEDVQEIGVDLSLKDNPAIFEVISKLAELGGKNGLNIRPNIEEGTN
jgi:hypothetical protein